jgi:hypothetical protein
MHICSGVRSSRPAWLFSFGLLNGLRVRLRRPRVREAPAGVGLERLATAFMSNRGSCPFEHGLSRGEQRSQVSHDALCRVAVPFGRNRAFLPLPGHHARKGRREFARIGSDQFVGPDRHGLRPFGVIMNSLASFGTTFKNERCISSVRRLVKR